jgi:predicted nucleic acid-binding Zn ribbon protein
MEKEIKQKKLCPNCKEEILKDAMICKHCGSKLDIEVKTTENVKAILIFVFTIIALIFIFGGNNKEKTDTTNKTETTEEIIKYRNERIDALANVMAYHTQKDFREGTKYKIAKGTSLGDAFKSYKEKELVSKNARWVVLKDGNRFVVIFRSKLNNGSLNNPQWAVLPADNQNILEGEIKALNGTAIKYTPELGYQSPKLNNDNFSESRKLYLRWMEISEGEKYIKILEGDDFELARSVEKDITSKVAKEFGVSIETADKMFLEGSMENVEEIAEINSERGDILSDEKILELIGKQGDLYIPEK